MKKIFTIILLAAGTISAASAQSRSQQSFAYNDSKKATGVYDEHFGFDKGSSMDYFSAKEKAAKLQKINREFDLKIAAVKSNRRLSSRQKNKQVQVLQAQRKAEISKVEYQFAKSHKAYGKAGHDSKKW